MGVTLPSAPEPTRRPGGFHAALGLFSVLPVPSFAVIDRVVARRAIGWLPAAGALLGCLSALAALLVWALNGSALLSAVVAVLVLAALTGGLHLDGLADTADGLGSRQPAGQALSVMRRSDIGPMGVVSIVGVLALDITALASITTTPWFLGFCVFAGAVVARAALWWATRPSIPPARAEGFGAQFAGVTSVRAAVVWTCGLLLVLSVLSGWDVGLGAAPGLLLSWNPLSMVAVLVAACGALLVGALWARHLVRRLGGLSGDAYGSIIEVAQATMWLGLALSLHLR